MLQILLGSAALVAAIILFVNGENMRKWIGVILVSLWFVSFGIYQLVDFFEKRRRKKHESDRNCTKIL